MTNSTKEEKSRQPVAIGIIGDFNPDSPYHRATNQAVADAASAIPAAAICTWVATPALAEGTGTKLAQFDALWCAPGSPYESMDGALKGIKFARENDWPFLGT